LAAQKKPESWAARILIGGRLRGLLKQRKMMAYTATGGVLSTASAVTAIATDPSLPIVVDLVLKLKAIESGKASSSGSSAPSRGVGLRNVVAPLKMFIAIQKRPWILPATVIGVLGAAFAAGYLTKSAVR
jgi:hypothetical protein